MPQSARGLIVAAIAAVLAIAVAGAAQAEGLRHTVGADETLSYLAQVYAVTVGEIVDLNAIADPDVIFPGQVLRIPGFGGHASEPVAPGARSYEVQPGDTLSGIAAEFGLTAEELMSPNGLADPDFLIIGQVLAIPGPAPHAAPGWLPETAPQNPELEALLEEMALAEGIDPGLVKALAWVESSWNQGAVSPAGALGVMQVMPDTALWLETAIFGYGLNEDTSAYDNIKMGTAFLRILLDATGGDAQMAIASYYQGLAPTQAGVLYDGAQGYVERVLAVQARFWP
ncbi:MAG: lytic transglycosylase domain-containing protein [Dehalococcoidia bacterium]|nr:lytic transglycosylase domain-containing protein [Dehalococcoidia bacterium]